MQVSELVAATRELVALFKQIEPRSWGVDAMLNELTAEVGTLADSVMIVEGYRRGRNEDIDLQDDIADILFMLLRIADYYQIDIDTAYLQMVQATKAKLTARLAARNSSDGSMG